MGRVVGLSFVARSIAQCSEKKAINASNLLVMFCMSGLFYLLCHSLKQACVPSYSSEAIRA
ncbi:MAG: hypothetical protein F6K28_00020 [Microcoleus sp. SIO2G3]|nr:hypothetical protein [Microcoleus sp. SIO2G3]